MDVLPKFVAATVQASPVFMDRRDHRQGVRVDR
jgi:hypothetical protein